LQCVALCLHAATVSRADSRATLNRYFGLGSAWAYYIYFAFGQQLFPSGNKPAWSDILEQMKVWWCTSVPAASNLLHDDAVLNC